MVLEQRPEALRYHANVLSPGKWCRSGVRKERPRRSSQKPPRLCKLVQTLIVPPLHQDVCSLRSGHIAWGMCCLGCSFSWMFPAWDTWTIASTFVSAVLQRYEDSEHSHVLLQPGPLICMLLGAENSRFCRRGICCMGPRLTSWTSGGRGPSPEGTNPWDKRAATLGEFGRSSRR